jgi:5-methylcytosine-specific restriction protein A
MTPPAPEPSRRKSPNWTRDEIILVASAVEANGWHEMRTGDAEVVELSRQLRGLDVHPPESRPENFRSPDSVSRKTADIMTAHSSYSGAPTKGGALTREVVRDFERDADLMDGEAKLLR